MTARAKAAVLATCCLSLLIVGMDNTIVNVALPSIRSDLHASTAGLQWTIDAYTLVLASLLVLAGSTADRVGRRWTFQTGLVLFSLGSLLCSAAPSLGFLIAFRMVQAVGGSMLNPVAMSIITNVFTEPRERARAIGVWGGAVGLSLGLGPVLGGLLTETVGWRSIFWINVPIGALAFVLAARFVPESKAPRPRRLDVVGQLLVLVTLASVVYAIIASPRVGLLSVETGGLLVLAVVTATALVLWEGRREQPLIELGFFRSAPFSGATVAAVCAFGGYSGFLFLNTLYLQDQRGYSALDAGLCTLPLAVMTLVFAPLSGRAVGRFGARPSLVLAGVGMVAGASMLVSLSGSTSLVWLLASYTVFGLGFGVVNAPITNTAVSGMPRGQAGVAAAIASTSRQVGASLGVAVVGAVVAGQVGRPGFAHASHPAWALVAGAGGVVLVLAFVTTGDWARRSAARVGEELDAQDALDQRAAGLLAV